MAVPIDYNVAILRFFHESHAGEVCLLVFERKCPAGQKGEELE
jgi:hypothetical protein